MSTVKDTKLFLTCASVQFLKYELKRPRAARMSDSWPLSFGFRIVSKSSFSRYNNSQAAVPVDAFRRNEQEFWQKTGYNVFQEKSQSMNISFR